MENKKYQLYVGRLQPIPSDVEYSYYNNVGNYILIYTNLAVPNTFKTVGDEYLDSLSQDEKRWLATAKMRINTQYINEHICDFQDVMNDFMTELEKELKTLKEKTVKEDKGN